MKRFLLIIAATTIFASWTPTEVRAGGDDKYWWGAGGLLLGGTAGYFAGREHQRWDDRYYRRGYNYQSYSPRPYYVEGQPPLYSPGYYEEKRVWPFYRHVEHYPVAGMEPVWGSPQTVSVLDLYDREPVAPAASSARPGDVTINIGDNNSEVAINIDGQPQENQPDEVTKTVTVPNENPHTPQGRVVDMPVMESSD